MRGAGLRVAGPAAVRIGRHRRDAVVTTMHHRRRNPSKPWPGIVATLLLLLPGGPPRAPAAAAQEDGNRLAGRWLTEDGEGVIDIAPCDAAAVAALCGRIVGLTLDGPEAPMPTDVEGRPLCGLPILEMRAEEGGRRWRGRITNPRDGARWRAEMWLGEDGSLRLRGYLGLPLFGRTQVWTPYAGRLLARCRMG